MTAPCPLFGFRFSMRLRTDVNETRADALLHAFIALVESRGLSAGGGGNAHEWSYVIEPVSGQAIDDDRHALVAWARARTEIADVTAGPLTDLHSE